MQKQKKAQSSTVGVIIAVVLGVILIVFLIWGFATNWSMFTDTYRAYTGRSNIDVIRNACSIACDADMKERWCSDKKTVVDEQGQRLDPKSCFQLKKHDNNKFNILDCHFECEPENQE